MRRKWLTVPCAIAALTAGTGLVQGQAARPRTVTAADLFDGSRLQELRIYLSSRDLTDLRNRYAAKDWYTADLRWRDIRVQNVGIRTRGFGSLTGTKPPLTIDVTRYASRQRFLGLSSLVLDNLWQDPSGLRERLAMTFFNRAGLPAPRVSSALVYINDEWHGVYTIVENLDEAFLARTIGVATRRGDPVGYLHEYHNLFPYYATDLGESLVPYKAMFEARTRTTEADALVYGPVRDLIREINGPFDAVWRSRVERHVDLGQLMTYVATENFIAEWDGVTGQWGMNNFHLYRQAESPQFRFIPWDADLSFYDVNGSIFQRSTENVLFSRAITFPDLRARYLEVMEHCAQVARQDNWLESQTAFVIAQIGGHLRNDAKKQYGNAEMDFNTANLVEFVRQRADRVLAEIAAARAPTRPR